MRNLLFKTHSFSIPTDCIYGTDIEANTGEKRPRELETPEPVCKQPMKAAKKSDKDAKGDTTPRGTDAKKHQKMINDVVRLKAKHMQLVSGAERLRRTIKEDPSWTWARSANTTMKFDKALSDLMAEETSFCHSFHTHSLNFFKKTMPLDVLARSCKNYVDSHTEKLSNVGKETTRLTKMHMLQNEEV